MTLDKICVTWNDEIFDLKDLYAKRKEKKPYKLKEQNTK